MYHKGSGNLLIFLLCFRPSWISLVDVDELGKGRNGGFKLT